MDNDGGPFQILEFEQIPFEQLETSLYEVFRIWEDRKNLRFVRESNLPSTIAEFQLYIAKDIKPSRPSKINSAESDYLGSLRFTKFSIDVTQIEQQCVVAGEKNKLYVELISIWKAHSSTFETISKAVRKRNKGKGLRSLKKGGPGRPSKAEDIWAWHQVNTFNRPINEVYKEWLSNMEVQKRELKDPKTHLYRYVKKNSIRD